MKRLATLAAVLALTCLALPSIAGAGVWTEGTVATPFTLSSAGGLQVVKSASGDPSLHVPYEASSAFSYPAIVFEPRSVRAASDGTYLVADGRYPYILKLSATWQLQRLYTVADFPWLARPFDAVPLDDGGMLVVDRGADKATAETVGSGRVVCLDSAGQTRWELNASDPRLAGKLCDPFTAEPDGAGRTLIADSLGNRVVQLDNSTGDVLWSYGTYLKSAAEGGQLSLPHSAQRLANGNVLICDSEAFRVIEVTPDERIVWSYATPRAPGSTSGPNSARRLANGNTLISDSDNNTVIEVNAAGSVVEAFGAPGQTPAAAGALNDPRAALRATDGSTIIADNLNHRLAKYGYHPRHEYVATSGLIYPSVGKVAIKHFSRISIDAVCPPGALLVAEYTTDDHTWLDVPAGGALPASTQGSAIRYRLRMTTGDASQAPVVDDVSITWSDLAPTTGKSGGNKFKSAKKSSTGSGSGSTGGSQSTSTGSGSGSASASGSGSQNTTTVAPGGSAAPIPGGFAGGSGAGGNGSVTQAANRSGWVMSEVKDDVGGTAGDAGTGSAGSGSAMGRSAAPGMALLLAAYTVGLAWGPASRAFGRVIVAAMTH